MKILLLFFWSYDSITLGVIVESLSRLNVQADSNVRCFEKDLRLCVFCSFFFFGLVCPLPLIDSLFILIFMSPIFLWVVLGDCASFVLNGLSSWVISCLGTFHKIWSIEEFGNESTISEWVTLHKMSHQHYLCRLSS